MKHLILIFLLFSLFESRAQVLNYDDFQGNTSASEMYIYDPEQADLLLRTNLTAYPDLFSQLSEYNFLFVRYNRRGYDNRFTSININAIDLSDEIRGSSFWDISSALSSVPKIKYSNYASPASGCMLGSIGDMREYRLYPSEMDREARVAWQFTDRSYRYGLKFGAASGARKSGWSGAVYGVRRWGRDRHIDGMWTDSWSLVGSVEKRIGKRNYLSISAITAPSDKAVRGASTQEAFELTGDKLYNPYWGFQNGSERASRVRNNRTSIFIASLRSEVSDKLHMINSIAYLPSEQRYSQIDWYSAQNPQPDYYRYMPGFMSNPDQIAESTMQWTTRNPLYTQINWADMIHANSNSSDEPASYILSDRVSKNSNIQFASAFSYRINRRTALKFGARFRRDRSQNYKQIQSLLGAKYIYDIDQFLLDDESFGDRVENNVPTKGKRLGVGDRFGYNYDLNLDSWQAWASIHFDRLIPRSKFFGDFGVQFGENSMQRVGRFEKELFPANSSFGESPEIKRATYMFKSSVGYTFDPSNVVMFNVAYGDMPQLADDAFMNPEYSNLHSSNTNIINVLNGELNYSFKRGIINFDVKGYATLIRGENSVYRYFDDLVKRYCNMVLVDQQKLFCGVEAAFGVTITPQFELKIIASKSQNRYYNDPKLSIYDFRDGALLESEVTSFIKGYSLSGTPQTVASAELRYSGPKMLNLALSVNYIADNFISLNPLNHTNRVMDLTASPESLSRLISQERFAPKSTINIFGSKTFRLPHSYVTLSLSVNNLADVRDIVYSGYEQMRFSKSGAGLNQDIKPFESKYYYAYGRTYFLSLSFKY